jgi:hypothetical protein
MLFDSNLKSIIIIIIYNTAFILCSVIPLIGKKYGGVFIGILIPYILNCLALVFHKYSVLKK